MIFTNDQFRLEIMKYLDEHWAEKVSAEEAAQIFGYSTQYFNLKFKESFGIPYLQYFTKLKLRRAAKEISEKSSLVNVAGKAGYSNPQSFSKAFRNEFGVSPRQFLDSEMEIPDMPVCCTIHGAPIEISYRETEPMVICGKVLYPVNGNHTDLKKEVGYYFDHIDKRDNLEEGEEWFDLWWHDEQFNTQYIIGKNAGDGVNVEEEAQLSDGMIQIKVQPDYYAVFSVKFIGGDCLKTKAAE